MQSVGTILHASCVACHGRAVLFRGASGKGKSGLSLQLLAFGAELVADDRTRVWREGESIMADAPDTIRGQIEARGLGILQLPASGPQPVVLVVDLDQEETERLPEFRTTPLLGVDLPCIGKSAFPHFTAALLLYLKSGKLS